MIAITAARLYTPTERVERPLVLIDGQTIAEVTSLSARQVPQAAQVINLGDVTIAPGLVDIHIHGGAGHDVMSADANGLSAFGQSLAAHGVTAYFPTTVTAPIEQTLYALDRLATAVEQAEHQESNQIEAHPLGIHLEGPFISHIRRGVHPPANLQRPSLDLFDRFWQAARGHIRLITIAPELDGAKELITEAALRGVCVSLGHTNSDLETARAAVAAGARHATHAFNAMRPLDHRQPGIVGAMLTDSRLSADIIADGVHIDPTVVNLFLKLKGPDLSVLITDATAATGMPDGHYRLGTMNVEVKDGRCMADGKLAGSVLTLDRAVRNAIKFAHLDLPHVLPMATSNPARIVGQKQRGKIEAGCRADLIVMNSHADVKATIVGGTIPESLAKA